MNILITGGAGFIGSAYIRYLLENTEHRVLNLDKLTYAGNLSSLLSAEQNPNYSFICEDICDAVKVESIINSFSPDAVIHLAAESHVDRSIDRANDFIQTNIVGTFVLLEACRRYWSQLPAKRQAGFRFHHVSTDEVYGELGNTGLFTENSPYQPSSPYSASKASSDHLVRTWCKTYGLPVLITNCSNNYGAYQFPEKLIPLMILNALKGTCLPLYGAGEQVRDWLYVEDHVAALYTVLLKGEVGETYNVGGGNELKNIEVVRHICGLLEELAPAKPAGISSYADLIEFVADRPGHDFRYAIDASKIKQELDWSPKVNFESGLRKTVQWFLNNRSWCDQALIQADSWKQTNTGSQERIE